MNFTPQMVGEVQPLSSVSLSVGDKEKRSKTAEHLLAYFPRMAARTGQRSASNCGTSKRNAQIVRVMA